MQSLLNETSMLFGQSPVWLDVETYFSARAAECRGVSCQSVEVLDVNNRSIVNSLQESAIRPVCFDSGISSSSVRANQHYFKNSSSCQDSRETSYTRPTLVYSSRIAVSRILFPA